MLVNTCTCISVWLVALLPVSLATTRRSQFGIRADTQLPTTYASHTTGSLTECCGLCCNDPGKCVSVNYHPATNECQLSIYEVVSAGIGSPGWNAAGLGKSPSEVNKVSSQISNYGLQFSYLALDGNRNTDYSACTHTDLSPLPWWKLTYTEPVRVTSVEILNRGEFRWERLHDVKVTVDTETCGEFLGPGTAGQVVLLTCPRVLVGVEVKIQITKGSEYLTLCQVTVH